MGSFIFSISLLCLQQLQIYSIGEKIPCRSIMVSIDPINSSSLVEYLQKVTYMGRSSKCLPFIEGSRRFISGQKNSCGWSSSQGISFNYLCRNISGTEGQNLSKKTRNTLFEVLSTKVFMKICYKQLTSVRSFS